MPARTVSMTAAPTDFQLQQQSIERQRRIAEALQQQSIEPLQGQTVPGGFYVAPHWTQQAARLAQALVSRKTQESLDEEQRDVAARQNKYFGDQAEELRYAMTPRPAVPEQNFGQGDARRQLSYLEHTDAPAPDAIRPAQVAYNPDQADMTAAIVKYLNATGNASKAADYVVSDAKNQMLINSLRGGSGAITPASEPVAGQSAPAASQGVGTQGAFQLLPPEQQNIVLNYLKAGKPEDGIKAMQDYLKPHVTADGRVVTMRNGQVSVPQGSVDAYTSFARAGKQFEAPVSLNTESGATVQLSPTEWADYQKTNRLPMRFLPENVRAGLQAEADASGAPGSVSIKTPQGMVGGEITPRVGISQSTAGKQQAEKQGTFFGDTYADLQKKGMASNDSISKYQRLSGLLEGIDTGKFTGTTLEIKKAAKAAGIDLGVADNAGPLEAARALTSEMALMVRNPDSGMGMPGAMSDADRNFIVNMQPGIETTPEGRKLLIETAVKMERRKQEIARLAREYKNGQLDNGFFQVVQDYANANPLFQGADASKPQPSTPSNPAGGKVDYKSRYGITTK